MRGFLTLLFVAFLSISAFSQDFLSVPGSNPALFPDNFEMTRDKLFFQRDTVVYEYETMQLPFIDDFSEDHFPALIKDPLNDPRVRDSLFYSIYLLNGQLYTDSQGFNLEVDPTFTYTLSDSGDTISTVPNPVEVIRFFEISEYPPALTLLNVYPPYNINIRPNEDPDTLFVEPSLVQDSIRYYIVEKDTSSFYLDRSVYRNNTMGFYPPSIGVATFDGLDQFGLPYNFNDISQNGRADNLTSVPIDLSAASDSTYFSFFYQAKGFALDGPNEGDSLTLEFYDSANERWGVVWNQRGLTSTAPVDSFRQVLIRVPSQFRTSEFQFRFRNLARLNGAYDNWHIDYLYLDDNRRRLDTAQKDISYVYPASSMLKNLEAMPVWHFKTDPSLYMTDTVRLLVRNNFDGPLNVFNKMVVPDTVNGGILFQFPLGDQFLPIQALGDLNFNYPMDFSYSSSDVDTTGVFQAICDIDFRPAPIEEKDFIRTNDTVYSRAVLSNYYAYDDGTAEAGYGINTGSQGGFTSFLAVRFDMPFQDTIGGIQMYFLPQANDIRSQSFKLTVWSSLSPPNIIFQKEVRTRALYDEKDAYISYFFDSLVLAGPTFYVGYEKTGQLSMNLGYDLNKNHKDKISWSLNGVDWSMPSNNIRDGSVMIRPILRKKFYGVGTKEVHSRRSKRELVIYPNPTHSTFQIMDQPSNIDHLQLYSVDGRLVREYDPSQRVYSVSGIDKGVYILRSMDRDGTAQNSRIIIQN